MFESEIRIIDEEKRHLNQLADLKRILTGA